MLAIPAVLVWLCWTGVMLRFVSPFAAIGLGFTISAMLLAWFCSTRGDFETIHWIAAVALHGLLFAWVPWMAAKGYNIAYEGWYGV